MKKKNKLILVSLVDWMKLTIELRYRERLGKESFLRGKREPFVEIFFDQNSAFD